MFLKLTFLNDVKHDSDFFGKIFSGPVVGRPMRGETLVSTSGEKYLVKDIIVTSEEVEWNKKKEDAVIYNYQLEKLEKKASIIDIQETTEE